MQEVQDAPRSTHRLVGKCTDLLIEDLCKSVCHIDDCRSLRIVNSAILPNACDVSLDVLHVSV
eukprot:scaffold18895_cov30-Tisochrysis_lutea.AAC.2